MANYILRNVPPDLWNQVRMRATEQNVPLRALILKLLTGYAENRIDSHVERARYTNTQLHILLESRDVAIVDLMERLTQQIMHWRNASRVTENHKPTIYDRCADDLEALLRMSRRSEQLRPHLNDINRTIVCWCGAEPGQPHRVER